MKTEIRTINSLSESETELINTWMEKEFGKKYIRNLKKYYSSEEARCFFIKEDDEIAAFGIINPVVADHLGEKHYIFGMGDLLTIHRSKGYGRILMEAIMEYLEKHRKTGLGFCARKNTEFYKKVGLGIKEDFMKRFRYKDPETGKISPTENGDGVFYEGDNFIQEILKTDELIYLDTKLW